MSQTTLAELQTRTQPAPAQNIVMSMDTVAGFESMQRIAKLFASSSITPKHYQNNLPDSFIAVDMAMRMGANPLMVMQNLYIVHGSPAWSAQFLIATFNKSGRFSAIRYEFEGKEGKDDWGCRAVTTELATKEKLVGPLITIGLAKKEGWHGKPGSKWQSMPEQMLRYRAAAWLVRAYAPEIAMGLHTAEEMRDAVIDVTPETPREITLETMAAQVNGESEKETDAKTVEQAEEDARPAQKPEQPKSTLAAEKPFPCAKENEDGTPRLVTSEDCFYCPDNEGCPNRA